MREMVLRLKVRPARDLSSPRDEPCGITQIGNLAMRTKNPTSLHFPITRPPRFFHFFNRDSAQDNRMLRVAHLASLNMPVSMSRASLILRKTQRFHSWRTGLSLEGRLPIHAGLRHGHTMRNQSERGHPAMHHGIARALFPSASIQKGVSK